MKSPIPPQRMSREEHRSLDLVQRMIISALIVVVMGLFAVVLALYLVLAGDRDLPRADVIGLWVMTGVLGIATAVAVVVINRRPFYSPWGLLGLLPMIVSAYWIFD